MSFRDVERVWSYSSFTKYAKEHKPYRDSPKDKPRYPLGARRYSSRFYSPIISAGTPYDWWDSSVNPPSIAIYYGERNKLGIYHPDDVFEFVSDLGYGQGEALLVSAVLPGYLHCEGQRGGYLFKHSKTGHTVPVFEGLRIRVCDGMPIDDYEIHVNVLDKKKTKEFRTKHDLMFKTGLAVLKAMGQDVIINELAAMMAGQVAPAMNYQHKDVHRSYDSLDPGGAMLWLLLRYDINSSQYYASYAQSSGWSWDSFKRTLFPENIVRNVKQHFYNEVYKNVIAEGGDIHKVKVTKFGDALPTTAWGYKIVLADTGEVRKQFK